MKDEPAPAGQAGSEAGARRRRVPKLVIGGRVLLVVAAIVVVLARMTHPSWRSATPDEAGVPDHWIPQTTLLIAFVFGLLAPALLLPIGSLRAVREQEGLLEVPTVLGWRSVPLDPVSARRLLIPGGGNTLDVIAVRSRWRLVFVTSSGSASPERELTPRLRRLWRDTSRRDGRTKPRVLGCLVLFGWSGVALLLMALLGGVAGVL